MSALDDYINRYERSHGALQVQSTESDLQSELRDVISEYRKGLLLDGIVAPLRKSKVNSAELKRQDIWARRRAEQLCLSLQKSKSDAFSDKSSAISPIPKPRRKELHSEASSSVGSDAGIRNSSSPLRKRTFANPSFQEPPAPCPIADSNQRIKSHERDDSPNGGSSLDTSPVRVAPTPVEYNSVRSSIFDLAHLLSEMKVPEKISSLLTDPTIRGSVESIIFGAEKANSSTERKTHVLQKGVPDSKSESSHSALYASPCVTLPCVTLPCVATLPNATLNAPPQYTAPSLHTPTLQCGDPGRRSPVMRANLRPGSNGQKYEKTHCATPLRCPEGDIASDRAKQANPAPLAPAFARVLRPPTPQKRQGRSEQTMNKFERERYIDSDPGKCSNQAGASVADSKGGTSQRMDSCDPETRSTSSHPREQAHRELTRAGESAPSRHTQGHAREEKAGRIRQHSHESVNHGKERDYRVELETRDAQESCRVECGCALSVGSRAQKNMSPSLTGMDVSTCTCESQKAACRHPSALLSASSWATPRSNPKLFSSENGENGPACAPFPLEDGVSTVNPAPADHIWDIVVAASETICPPEVLESKDVVQSEAIHHPPFYPPECKGVQSDAIHHSPPRKATPYTMQSDAIHHSPPCKATPYTMQSDAIHHSPKSVKIDTLASRVEINIPSPVRRVSQSRRTRKSTPEPQSRASCFKEFTPDSGHGTPCANGNSQRAKEEAWINAPMLQGNCDSNRSTAERCGPAEIGGEARLECENTMKVQRRITPSSDEEENVVVEINAVVMDSICRSLSYIKRLREMSARSRK